MEHVTITLLILISLTYDIDCLEQLENSHEPHYRVYNNHASDDGNIKHVQSKISPLVQRDTAQKAVERLLGHRSRDITIRVDPNLSNSYDSFQVDYEDVSGIVVITGTTGVAALYGVNDYLKYHCHCQIAWEGEQLLLPNPLPLVTYQKHIVDKFRYYQNVCTDSYSYVWWNWTKWEKEIDWMAFHGINMPLAFTGQEEIWRRVYQKFGFSTEFLSDYVTGPAFLAWWRMGNVNKWGGPTHEKFFQQKLALLHKIIDRMRNFGMTPVLPCFAGNVPDLSTRPWFNGTIIKHPSWNGFNSSYATYMLPPNDPWFREIGKQFLTELIAEVGTNHVYSCDTFNENDPSENSTLFLKTAAEATYAAMALADPKAVWMMQSWVFQSPFWATENVKAYLEGVAVGNAIILDLEAERRPLYSKLDNFFGHKFIWSMLQNFGGTLNMFGNLDAVHDGIFAVRGNASFDQFLGIGATPEGINQNSIIFEFLYDTSWRIESFSVTGWISEYTNRRYGIVDHRLQEMWQILRNGVYNAPRDFVNNGRSVIVKRPSLRMREEIWYNPNDIKQCLVRLLKTASTRPQLVKSTLFRYDVVNITRQFLQLLFALFYAKMVDSFRKGQIEIFAGQSKNLLSILDDMESILGSNERFLLGTWVKDAESWGDDIGNLRYNALNQITLWGPTGEISDYAAKQWAGCMKYYYKPRWESFIMALNSSLTSGNPFNYNRFRAQLLEKVETPFTRSQMEFSPIPKGNTIEEATRIYEKWRTQNFSIASRIWRKRTKKVVQSISQTKCK